MVSNLALRQVRWSRCMARVARAALSWRRTQTTISQWKMVGVERMVRMV